MNLTIPIPHNQHPPSSLAVYQWISIQHAFNSLDVVNKFNIIILSFVFVVGIIGNASVIFTFYASRNHQRHTHFESRLVLLAVIDLLSSAFIPTLFIYGTLTHFQAPHLTEPVCKVWLTIFPLSVSISQGRFCLLYTSPSPRDS